MSEGATRQHKSAGSWAALVPLLTALLVLSRNQSVHLLQGKHTTKAERSCQMGAEKCSHRNGVCYPRDNRIPCFVQRLPGSWQHTHLAHFVNGCYRQCSRAPESACSWGTSAQQWQQSCQTFTYRRSWMKKTELRKAEKKTEKIASWQGYDKRDKNLWILREWGHPHCPIGPESTPSPCTFPLLVARGSCCLHRGDTSARNLHSTNTNTHFPDWCAYRSKWGKMKKKFII